MAVAEGNERRGKVVAARLKDAANVWATKRRRQWAIFCLGVFCRQPDLARSVHSFDLFHLKSGLQAYYCRC
jgi:hypothetical protein